MANDGKLYIIITDKREGGGAEPGVEPANNEPSIQQKNGSDYNIIRHQFNNFVIGQAKQFVNYNINNIGNFTGDYIAQRRVNEVRQAVNIGTTLIGATLAYGPIGGLIAAAGIGINAGYESYTQRLENKRMNYNIEQLQRRSGLNINLDGSRGTEN